MGDDKWVMIPFFLLTIVLTMMSKESHYQIENWQQTFHYDSNKYHTTKSFPIGANCLPYAMLLSFDPSATVTIKGSW